MKRYTTMAIALLLVALAVLGRFVPHAPNFVPVAAIALVAGYCFRSRLSLLLPMGAMFISDLAIGFYSIGVMVSVYASYLLIWGIGRYVQGNAKSSLLPSAITGSIFFFLVTNAAVWAFTELYPNNIAGLAQSFYYGLPFLKWTLLGDLFYTSVLVGLLQLAEMAEHRFAFNQVTN